MPRRRMGMSECVVKQTQYLPPRPDLITEIVVEWISSWIWKLCTSHEIETA